MVWKKWLSHMQKVHLFLLTVLHQPPLLIHLTWIDASTLSLWVLPKAFTKNLISRFKWHKEETSLCFFPGPIPGTAKVKMGQVVTCTHTYPFFHLMESKQYTCASSVCMSLPIPITFFPFIFLSPLAICSHMLLRRRNIKLVKNVLESMSSKNRNPLSTYSILDMRVNKVNVNRMISLLNSLDIRGLLWEDPLPSDKHRR